MCSLANKPDFMASKEIEKNIFFSLVGSKKDNEKEKDISVLKRRRVHSLQQKGPLVKRGVEKI
jgi:hypothetical protein